MKYEKGGKKSISDFAPMEGDEIEELETMTTEEFMYLQNKMNEAWKKAKPHGRTDA